MKPDRKKLVVWQVVFIIFAFTLGCFIGATIAKITEVWGQERTLIVKKFPITHCIGQITYRNLVQIWRDLDDNDKAEWIEVRIVQSNKLSLPIAIALDTTGDGRCNLVYTYDVLQGADRNKDDVLADIWGDKIILVLGNSTAVGKPMRELRLFNESLSAITPS